MTKRILSLLLIFFFAYSVNAEEKQEMYELPENNETPVIVYDVKGMFEGNPLFVPNKKSMMIYPDGSVVIQSKMRGMEDHKGKLTSEGIQDLLGEIVKKRKFFDINPKELKKKIESAKKESSDSPPAFKKAAKISYYIKITLKDKNQEFEIPFPNRQLTDLDEYQMLYETSEDLTRLQSIFSLGGKEKVEELLKLGNEQLKKEYPNVAPLKIEHLISGFGSKRTGLVASFSRSTELDESREMTSLSVIVNPILGNKIRVFHRKFGK